MNIIRTRNQLKNWLDILLVSTRLGLTSFGGPTAHLGYFHHEYVSRRRWLDEREYADLVALCQFLPGPASSQVGLGIGLIRGGIIGGFVAFLGFTLPSVIALASFALLMQGTDLAGSGWIHGLKLVAVAIVAQAVFGMGQKLAAGRKRITIAVLTAAIVLIWPTTLTQAGLILAAGIIGLFLFKSTASSPEQNSRIPLSKTVGVICLILFFGLFILLPVLREVGGIDGWIAVFDSFYRSGSLVFGGGHVVLPLLEREFVPTGWVGAEEFLAGYGAAQAVPGPLFTFAAYIGALIGGWSGALFATFAIFLPAILLVIGVLPFWHTLRQSIHMQRALRGVNAAVVGILLAALYDPIFISTVGSAADFAIVCILFIMLQFWKLPPWIIVIAGAISGILLEVGGSYVVGG